jgi:alpha-L-fucosidase
VWGASTHAGTKIYIHVLTWDGIDGPLTLPPIPGTVLRSSLLTGGTAPPARQTSECIEISVPPKARRELDTIIVLELDGPAAQIAPTAAGRTSLTDGKTATASNVYQGMAAYGPGKAVDGDDGTRWATDAGTGEAWLEVDLGAVKSFDQARIHEAYDRVRRFELQYRRDGEWVAFHHGTTIGAQGMIRFPPVTTRHVRLQILEAIEGPTIWEFQLFEPGKNRKR